MNDQRFLWSRALAGVLGALPRAQSAALLGVGERQVRRWLAGNPEPPAHVVQSVAVLLGGDLGRLSARWAGWRLYRGELYSPEGVAFDPGAVRALGYLYALVAEQRRELARLRGDPLPADGWENIVPLQARK